MWLVVGLGNPGRAYAAHRHNVGFMALDELAARTKAEPFRERFSGRCARADLEGQAAILLEPCTFMNGSGESVQPAMAFYKVEPSELLVIHDELDLPFGTVRLKRGGGHAGHNGLRSVAERLGTTDFGRVRVGIGRPPPGWPGEVRDWVLSRFDPAEASALPATLKLAVESVLQVALRGFGAAMNVQNARRPAGDSRRPREKKEESSTEPKSPTGPGKGSEPDR